MPLLFMLLFILLIFFGVHLSSDILHRYITQIIYHALCTALPLQHYIWIVGSSVLLYTTFYLIRGLFEAYVSQVIYLLFGGIFLVLTSHSLVIHLCITRLFNTYLLLLNCYQRAFVFAWYVRGFGAVVLVPASGSGPRSRGPSPVGARGARSISPRPRADSAARSPASLLSRSPHAGWGRRDGRPADLRPFIAS